MQHTEISWIIERWFCSLKREASPWRNEVVYFRGRWSGYSRWSWKAEVEIWDMFPEPTESRLIGCLTESIWIHRFGSGMLTPRINSQTFWSKDISHEMNGSIFLFNINFCSSQSCSEFNSQNCTEGMAKRQQEGDYDERVVAKSKPVRSLVSKSYATTPSSTVSSCTKTFGSKDYEMRFETRTGKPGSTNQQESLIKRDRVPNSQESREDTRSRATTGSHMTREPIQTEDPTACMGRFCTYY